MARPVCCRKIERLPEASFFKPTGIPMHRLKAINLTVDEFEAVRLADLEGLYQEAAAERMQISRQTFGRVLTRARRKVADFLVNAGALRIDGGRFEMLPGRRFGCHSCGHTWQQQQRNPRHCPSCRNETIEEDQRETE